MSNMQFFSQARDDFNKARTREMLSGVLRRLVNRKSDMLSLQDARNILKPKSENYKGMMTVPISLIVGSEGRYKDFNKEFLPKHQHLRSRWERVDVAYYKQVNLPPIKLYKLGKVYFVRDGNHRVSVGKLQGVEFVDAEVVGLTAEVEIEPWMNKDDLKREVIKFEKKKFFDATKLDKLRKDCILDFTAPGRYDDIIEHIKGHRYFLQERQENEVSFEEAMLSWYDTVFQPIIRIIRDEKILNRFPGRTEADLYVWIVRHWDELKKKWGNDYPLDEAAKDYSRKYGRRFSARVKDFLQALFKLFTGK